MRKNVDLGDILPMGFLLKKNRHGRYLDAYRMKPIKIDYFTEKLKSTLDTVHERYENREIRFEHMHEDTDDDAVVILDVDDYQTIRHTIEGIFRHADANPLDSLKSMKNVKFSAMLFDIQNDSAVITIDSVSVFSKAFFEKGGFVATYDDKFVDEFKKDSVLAFEYGLPCIYFEKERKLLVLDRNKTEEIFNLIEYYKKNAETKFQELVDSGIIEVADDILNSELRGITVARQVNNMIKANAFTRDIDYYKKYEEKSSDFDDNRTKITIRNNKVIINDKDDFRSFLHITKDDILESIVDSDQKFLSYKKRPITRRTGKST